MEQEPPPLNRSFDRSRLNALTIEDAVAPIARVRPAEESVATVKRDRARLQRRNPSPAERAFWPILNSLCKSRGVRIHRQAPILGYVADFYIPAGRLVIELDGPSHEGRAIQDAHRDGVLKDGGFRTFRIKNDEVLVDPYAAAALAIAEVFGGTTAPTTGTDPNVLHKGGNCFVCDGWIAPGTPMSALMWCSIHHFRHRGCQVKGGVPPPYNPPRGRGEERRRRSCACTLTYTGPTATVTGLEPSAGGTAIVATLSGAKGTAGTIRWWVPGVKLSQSDAVDILAEMGFRNGNP